MTDKTETFLAFAQEIANESRALLVAAAEEAPRVDLKQDAAFEPLYLKAAQA